MADDPGHRRHQSANEPREIPLQNLNRDGNLQEQGDALNRHATHRRTLSDRGRALLRRSREYTPDQRYAPLQESSPSPTQHRGGRGPVAFVTTPAGQQQRIPDEDDENVSSPIEDQGAFQSAISFAGLSMTNMNSMLPDEDDSEPEPPSRSRPQRASRAILPPLMTSRTSTDAQSVQLDDGPAFFSPGVADEDDMQPLTHSSPSQRRSTLAPSTLRGQRHDRDSGRSSNLGIRFLSPGQSSGSGRNRSGSNLGDDLPNTSYTGYDPNSSFDGSRSSRQRSFSSAETPLRRTGTMFKNMSQRVVNVSNESDVVDRETRRRNTISQRKRSPSPNAFGAPMDGAQRSPASEKSPSPSIESPNMPIVERNFLRGKALGMFSPNSKIRQSLLELLVHPWFEPVILLLIVFQTVILAVGAANSVFDPNHARPRDWGHAWSDYALLVIFIIYTLEIGIKVIVSGIFFNPREYSTIDRSIGFRQAVYNKIQSLFALHRKDTVKKGDNIPVGFNPSLIRSFTADWEDISGGSRQAQKRRLAHRAFLRHSFNRVDFLAVVSFWISFILATVGWEATHEVYVFRMLSCLRILRLLGITSGTSVILRSLKRAAPILLNVAFLIGFFWLLFAIVGVQSFKSSLRRNCVWNYNQTFYPDQQPYTQPMQFCGGYLAPNGSAMPWVKSDGSWGQDKAKGYWCPVGTLCVEQTNPYNGTVSFDNVFQSIELVFVIMTNNTFTDLLYYLTNSDYLIAALFFACGTIFLTLWMLNLLIAVITSSFQVIREESKSSAFTADERDPLDEKEKDERDESPTRVSLLKKIYDKCHWLWIIVIVIGLVTQCVRNDTMSQTTTTLIKVFEIVVTVILDVEIVWRFVADWRGFVHGKRNWFDLFLAVVTSILLIPVIHNSGAPYAWLSVFEILRIYRVVLAVKLTRDLITLVLRHVSGVLNLILFVFLLTFLASIFATQLFRGELPAQDSQGNAIQVPFMTIYNAFLGMYQLLSSENWTTILYNVTRFTKIHNTAWIGAIFLILWYILANFIVLNMFIAVIQENFDVSEDQKRLQQVRMFLQQKELGQSSHGTLSLSTIFKFGFMKRQDPLDFGNAATEMLLKDKVVQDFLDEQMKEQDDTPKPGIKHTGTNFVRGSSGWLEKAWAWIQSHVLHREPNPFYTRLKLSKAFEELDPRTLAKEVVEATEQRKVKQREYLRTHPNYNTSLYLFKPDNAIRRFCQRIVGPGRGGERIEGRAPNVPIWYAFSAFVYAAIVAMVLLACVTTPLYQREWFERHPYRTFNWFVLTDMGFAGLFTIEAIIKIIADGFFWTPHAYMRSSWGFIDAIVLITLWANVIVLLRDPGGGSRAVGAFKALRALRLLNVSDSARDTFHSVIILGGVKVVSAAFVSLSLLIPFAIYGLNLFSGQMQQCNDGNNNAIYNLTDCVGEYFSSPYQSSFPAPRQVANSYYSFDNFGGSLFILFQIVSQEGWVDVMNAAQSITGMFTQPNQFAAQGNAMFFVIFNLMTTVFVLTLFVSVFMRNYTEQTGVAFLTAEQRSWLELRKMLRQVAPSKRPNNKKKRVGWQEWCYRRAITKNGAWQRTITGLLVAHLILLCLEWYPDNAIWSRIRVFIFLAFTLAYTANVIIRLIGLSWTRFRKSAWDVYSLFSIGGSLVTTILVLTNFGSHTYLQVYKLFMVSVVLLLIPRNNQLDQLFKTAAASVTAIANLMATWFVLFLVFAIALTQTFGLTRFGQNENGNINFRTVPKALILLFRMSMGEGWNQLMNDFSIIQWPYCTIGERYYDGDCGSSAWARALFVAWNILSMYIFVNLFISLIYESFSYVYQRSSGLSIISREEVRRFKQAWAEFDPDGTGYISKEVFPRFLGELSGIFEMRIYDGDFSVRTLLEDCRVGANRNSVLPLDGAPSVSDRVDLAKLNQRLSELPVDEIRKRRARMNTFYEEVLVSSDPDRGIPFNSLLMILAHYKVINDSKSLKLEEYLRRRARLQRVEEAVNRNIVVGFFDTLYWSRQFRRRIEARKEARLTAVPQPQLHVPEILIQGDEDDKSSAPGVPTVSVTPVDAPIPGSLQVGHAASSRLSGSDAETVRRGRGGSTASFEPGASEQITTVQHRSSPSASSIEPTWHFAAAMERTSADGLSPPPSPGGAGSGLGSSIGRSPSGSTPRPTDMMGNFQDSAWGQSMRRSFTQRRSSEDRRGSRSERRPSAV